AGGAAGAIFVGILAPRIFTGIYELPVALILTSVLALLLTWKPLAGAGASATWMLRILWLAVTAAMIFVFQANVTQYSKDALYMQRSFYGALRVVQSPRAGPRQTRTLFHGAIEHGAQFILPPMRFRPTTYYGPDSGIGILLRECFSGPKRVGIIGLGVGTIAAYGRPGDTFRFYEINPQVVDAARSLFTYLRETPAKVQVVVGDGRLSLEQDHSPPFDVLAIDAFSGDAIPVHLLTIEAARLYQTHLKAGGAMAFHVSNDYLDLAPVVGDLAQALGYRAIVVHNNGEDDGLILPADWVLVTNNPEILDNPAIQLHSEPIDSRPGLRLWTDNFNNLVGILKTPRLQ
ncbi:MAG TPA: fused MFS/spermidine synthase, partial [Bryobacteraceae bacterium]|nr:fused MFS/spermidine synthase [Bryobacteraceae bacterium]